MRRDDLAFTPGPTDAAARPPLRFLTAGSVDDGKSTLIGRLLLDGQALLADQLDALESRAQGRPIDLSLVTDGLEAEREQGITIDVAHRYFATPQRKFVIADAPGHEQYTRNMVTAAAGSDAAVVLVDATRLAGDDADGTAPVALLPQTRRHALIAKLLGVDSVVFAVNKLDAVADPSRAFGRVREALVGFARDAGIAPAGIVPISALRGDNVTHRSGFVTGYDGPALLALLESLPNAGEAASALDSGRAFVLPVQFVDAGGHDAAGGVRQRVFWGRVARGAVAAGDVLVAWPSGERATVVEVHGANGRVDLGGAGRSAGIVLDRPLDVSRGDWLASPGALAATDRVDATLAWLDTEPAVVGRKYVLRHGSRWVPARLAEIAHRLDIATLAEQPAAQLAANDIGSVTFDLQAPLPLRAFAEHRVEGALVVVDPATNRTSGVLLVR